MRWETQARNRFTLKVIIFTHVLSRIRQRIDYKFECMIYYTIPHFHRHILTTILYLFEVLFTITDCTQENHSFFLFKVNVKFVNCVWCVRWIFTVSLQIYSDLIDAAYSTARIDFFQIHVYISLKLCATRLPPWDGRCRNLLEQRQRILNHPQMCRGENSHILIFVTFFLYCV